MKHNRKELLATGGGPNTQQPITDLEESVSALLELNTYTEPPGKEFGDEILIVKSDEEEQNVPKILTTPTVKTGLFPKKPAILDAILELKKEKFNFNKAMQERHLAVQERHLAVQERKLAVLEKQLALQEKQSSVTSTFFS